MWLGRRTKTAITNPATEELEQVGKDHIDFDIANVSCAGATGDLTKLVRCQHGSPLAPLIRGTSASRSFRRAYNKQAPFDDVANIAILSFSPAED